MIHIREGVAVDAPWIVAAVASAVADGDLRHTSEERVLARLAEPTHVLYVGVIDGRRVGFATVSEIAPRLWEIGNVVATERRRGFGRALVRHAVAHVFDEFRGHRLYLEVTAKNAAARALYESEGFVCEGCFRDGFPAEDGSFRDLLPYGMLAGDRRP